MIPVWWSVALTTIGVAGLYLVTRKRRAGFVVGLAVQLLWVAYAVATRQWGFLGSAVAYGAVNALGYFRFRPTTTATKPPQVTRRRYEPWRYARGGQIIAPGAVEPPVYDHPPDPPSPVQLRPDPRIVGNHDGSRRGTRRAQAYIERRYPPRPGDRPLVLNPRRTSMTITDQDIARVTHEANRALQIIDGDPAPSPAWDDAPQWQRDSAVEGVAKAKAGATPEELHQSWVDFKVSDGWVHGPVKDADAKTHPALLPYDELPEGQRVKDGVFGAIVGALT